MGVNYLAAQFGNEQAANVVKNLYDIDGKAIALPGALDCNFKIKTASD